jgi:hypothetical protein
MGLSSRGDAWRSSWDKAEGQSVKMEAAERWRWTHEE